MVVELQADDDAALGTALDRVGDELGVDHTLRTIEAETYVVAVSPRRHLPGTGAEGVAERAFALEVSVMRRPPAGNHGLVVLFDAELVLADGSELEREGCMSVRRKRFAEKGEHLK